MPIEGKVARVLNERDLVVNKGSEAGVKEGMKFKITEPDIVIVDPDTKESLGMLNREKIRVNIVDVQPKFSIGKTYETYTVNTFPNVISFTTTRRVVRKLRSGQGEELKATDQSGDFVEIGDPVVQIEDDV